MHKNRQAIAYIKARQPSTLWNRHNEGKGVWAEDSPYDWGWDKDTAKWEYTGMFTNPSYPGIQLSYRWGGGFGLYVPGHDTYETSLFYTTMDEITNYLNSISF